MHSVGAASEPLESRLEALTNMFDGDSKGILGRADINIAEEPMSGSV